MQKLVLFTCVALFLVIGCQREPYFLKSENRDQETIIPRILIDSVVVTEDGALKFLSTRSYFKIIDTLNTWHDSMLDKWEEMIGFTSMRKVVNELLKEGNRSLREDAAFVSRYPTLLTLDGKNIEPLIPIFFYRMILNESSYFYLLDDKYVVTEKHLNVFFSDNTSDTPDLSLPYYLGESRAPDIWADDYAGPDSGYKLGHTYDTQTLFTSTMHYLETRYKYYRNFVRDIIADEKIGVFNYGVEIIMRNWEASLEGTYIDDIAWAPHLNFTRLYDLEFKIQDEPSLKISKVDSIQGSQLTVRRSISNIYDYFIENTSNYSQHQLELLRYTAFQNNHPVTVEYVNTNLQNLPKVFDLSFQLSPSEARARIYNAKNEIVNDRTFKYLQGRSLKYHTDSTSYRWTFDHWLKNGIYAGENSDTITFSLTGNTVLTAVYCELPAIYKTLSISKSPEDVQATITGQGTYEIYEDIPLKVVGITSNHYFTGFYNPSSLYEIGPSTRLTNQDVNIEARFEQKYPLYVERVRTPYTFGDFMEELRVLSSGVWPIEFLTNATHLRIYASRIGSTREELNLCVKMVWNYKGTPTVNYYAHLPVESTAPPDNSPDVLFGPINNPTHAKKRCALMIDFPPNEWGFPQYWEICIRAMYVEKDHECNTFVENAYIIKQM